MISWLPTSLATCCLLPSCPQVIHCAKEPCSARQLEPPRQRALSCGSERLALQDGGVGFLEPDWNGAAPRTTSLPAPEGAWTCLAFCHSGGLSVCLSVP